MTQKDSGRRSWTTGDDAEWGDEDAAWGDERGEDWSAGHKHSPWTLEDDTAEDVTGEPWGTEDDWDDPDAHLTQPLDIRQPLIEDSAWTARQREETDEDTDEPPEPPPLTRRAARRQGARSSSSRRKREGSSQAAPVRRRRRGGLVGFLREIVIVLVAALVLSWCVKTFFLQPFWIPTGSMETTLHVRDRVMVSKLTPGVFDLKRGDVIVFKDPGGWLEAGTAPAPQSTTPEWLQEPLQYLGLAPETADKYLIKRVIGLPGDKIDGVPGEPLKINGAYVTEPYLYEGARPTDREFHITVPAGRVWVMGDHRNASGDSRFHDDGGGSAGSVPVEDIQGRAILVVWPLGHGKWLDNYQPVFQAVPAADA